MSDIWSSIAASASAATGALGSALHSIGAGASSMATAAPGAIATVAGGPAHLAQSLAVVEKPMSAAAKGMRSSPWVVGAARFLSKALPVTAITASTVTGARIVQRNGFDALIETKAGRNASLGALGGALALVPVPPAQVAAAGVLGVGAANHFGAFDHLNVPQSVRQATKRA